MSNILYIDANRQNSMFHNDENNEWQTKLNTETLLPKGTAIQIQTSFINKKGINGGSIEIDEDILETISYYFYITEQPHLAPQYMNPPTEITPWFRSTLACDGNTFRGNFDGGVPAIVPQDVVYGKILTTYGGNSVAGFTQYNGVAKTPDFLHYGGTSAILPHCKWVYNAEVHPVTNPQTIPRADYVLKPDIRELDIFIPAGVYGIGELSQLVEDQINGVKYYDPLTQTIIDQNNTFTRRDDPSLYNVDAQGDPLNYDMFNGKMYNKPILTNIDVFPRYFQTSKDVPEIATNVGGSTFINMEDFQTMANYLTSSDGGVEGNMINYPLQGFSHYWMKGDPAQDTARNADTTFNRVIRPFYMLRTNFDDGSTGLGGDKSAGHTLDGFIENYNIYDYDFNKSHRKKLIGTNNFSFRYDSEKNGYSINGLHNCIRSPSHDRYGSKITSAGQTVINFKQIRSGGVTADYTKGAGVNGNWTKNVDGTANVPFKIIRNKIVGALNTPETRTMGIAIVNFGLKTCKENKTNPTTIPTQNLAKFRQFFNTDQEAKKMWEKTLWYRLGFDYDQLNESTGTNIKYDKGSFSDYGFTTDVDITNDIVPTISTLNNPTDYKPAGDTDKEAGFQLFNNLGYSSPHDEPIGTPAMQPVYANSPYYECAIFPVIIADVGGVIARRLPALSKHPYYLITTDLCDNYKDNVKKGDVLPLIGVVPKTSLSNQDFITAENQIVQILSQDKIINKFNIKILNPDLTAPQLEENSSIILKLTLPNITPLSLLELNPANKKLVQQIQAEQTELVGN